MRPLIAIPTYQTIHPVTQRPTFWMFQPYVRAVEHAGGIAVLLPLNTGDMLSAILERVDGLLLAGGDDLDPHCYGQDPHPAAEVPDQVRDQSEMEAARYAVHHKVPLLAICRGLQTLNVALGGTLVQDIPSLVPNALQHSYDYNGDYPHAHVARHSVNIAPGSRTATIFASGGGSDKGIEDGVDKTAYESGCEIQVNSFHHQAIDHVATPLCATGIAPDGIIEAIELPDLAHFVVGVQWHPEDMYRIDHQQAALFRAFIAACAS